MPEKFSIGTFGHLDKFVIVNSETNKAVQGEFDQANAASSCETLNKHGAEYGRAGVYDIRELPFKLRGRKPTEWQQLLNEGEESRQIRIDAIPKLMKFHYPPAFVVVLSKHIAEHGDLKSANWDQLHDAFLEKSIGRDVRDPPQVLSELLQYSPGVVTHEEQDALCDRLDELMNLSRQDSDVSNSQATFDSSGRETRAPARFRP